MTPRTGLLGFNAVIGGDVPGRRSIDTLTVGLIVVRAEGRTRSGAVAVQEARRVAGRDEVVEHVGSAHTDAELGLLIEHANRINNAGQEKFDLDVPATLTSMDSVASWRPDAAPAALPGPAVVAGPGRAVGTSSRVLFDALADVYDQLGFDVLGDRVFRDLVIARIVEVASKRDSIRILTDLGAEPLSYRTIQRHLGKVGPGKYRRL